MSDPALDLAVVMAVLSSNIDAALPADTVFAGEVGLSGEIRAVVVSNSGYRKPKN